MANTALQDKGTKTVFIAVDLQPDETQLVVLHRYYAKHSQSPQYIKRMSWIESAVCSIAVYEYKGQFPQCKPHGKASTTTNNYVRVKPTEFERITEELKSKNPKYIIAK